ncbi:hypothetical protein STANM309S_04410 [Streptomyces tanashiensis]
MTSPETTSNLHRELAPITAAAWAEIEEEARAAWRAVSRARPRPRSSGPPVCRT